MKIKNIKPLLRGMGSKLKIRDKIVSMFPAGFQCYVEVFARTAAVLFGIPPVNSEVLNDKDGDLMAFYQVIKEAHKDLTAEFEYELVSRERFYQYRDRLREGGLTPLKRAKYFYYTIMASFGGLGQYFGVSTTRKPSLNLKVIDDRFKEGHNRLKNVVIESLDFRDILKCYDRPHTLFYLDPPYRVPASKEYPFHMTDVDYEEMFEILLGLKGKFVLSLNDDPFIRKLFSSWFWIEEIDQRYSLNPGAARKVKELIITNYKI